jgi:hypothetical protein
VQQVEIKVGPEMFRFHSKQHWVNKAKSWFARAEVHREDFVCIDAAGRLCRYGKQFIRAEEDGTYPIVVYRCDDPPEEE